MQQIHELLVDKEFGEAKYKWLDKLPNSPVIANGKVDVFGNENQTVITGLAKVLSTTVTSTCSEPNCPLPIRNVKSYSIELGLLPGRKNCSPQLYFRDCAMQWFNNNIITNCMRTSISGNFCPDTRSCSERKFDNDFPLLLPFNVELFSGNGSINCINDLPLKLNFTVARSPKMYKLFAVTYGSGAHFISAIKMSPQIMKQDGWFLYDGLMEKRKQGTGVQILPDDPKPPHTYRLSYVVYLKD